MKQKMTTATRAFITQNGTEIKITLTREVSDDVGYADGWYVPLGRKVYEQVEVIMTTKDGKTARGSTPYILDPKFDKAMIAQGAYARCGDGYLRQPVYDLIMVALAQLQIEIPKTAEQIEIEAANAEAEAKHDVWYDSPEQIAARKFAQAMDDPNSDL